MARHCLQFAETACTVTSCRTTASISHNMSDGAPEARTFSEKSEIHACNFRPQPAELQEPFGHN